MFKERSTEKLIEYIQSLPDREQKVIVKTLSNPKTKKVSKSHPPKTEQGVLNNIKQGLEEIKQSKRTGRPLKSLEETLHELKSKR